MQKRAMIHLGLAAAVLLTSHAIAQSSDAQTSGPDGFRQRLERRAALRQPRPERTPRPKQALRSESVSGSSQPLPPPGVYDLSLTGDMNLAGAIFKDGYAFLHNEGSGTALGYQALDSLTAGTFNTAVGANALTNNTQGRGNTAVGDYAARGNVLGFYNTAVGQYALDANQYTDGNTAVGWGALEYSVGYGSSYLSANTAVGSSALGTNTMGFYNTAVGASALAANSVGFGNAAFGHQSLTNNIGYSIGDVSIGANTAAGAGSLAAGTTAYVNTAVGYYSLAYLTTGSYNVALGAFAAEELTGAEASNVLINSKGVESESNTLRIGQDSGTGARHLDAAYIHGIFGRTIDNLSDVSVLIDDTGKLGTMASARRYKDEIEDLGDRSEALLELRPVSFRYKHDDPKDEATLRYGLIAEEVAEIYPELVVFNDDGEPETVKYHLLSAMLINELQRQRARTQAQDREIDELRKGQDQLRRRLEAIESP